MTAPDTYNAPSMPVFQRLDPVARDDLDARRSMWFDTPEASVPDGYLGTIVDRREDRLLDAVKRQLNRRSYDRGVHVGERIDQGDYFWPENFVMKGLLSVAAGVRQAPTWSAGEQQLMNDGKPGPMIDEDALIDPVRAAQLRPMRPPWV